VFARFVPPHRPDEVPGCWRRYFERWSDMTRERMDPKLIELLPDLHALVPPAAVVDKHRYSPFTASGLLALLREWDTEALVVTGAETEVCVLATVLGAVDLGSGSWSRPTPCAARPTTPMTRCSRFIGSGSASR
jgi:nicotinamidase-related amidase